MFYAQSDKHAKLGVHEDSTNCTGTGEHPWGHAPKSDDVQIGLKEHIECMKEGKVQSE